MTHTDQTAQDMPDELWCDNGRAYKYDKRLEGVANGAKYTRSDLCQPPVSPEYCKAALGDINKDLDSGNYCGQLFLSRESYDIIVKLLSFHAGETK